MSTDKKDPEKFLLVGTGGRAEQFHQSFMEMWAQEKKDYGFVAGIDPYKEKPPTLVESLKPFRDADESFINMLQQIHVKTAEPVNIVFLKARRVGMTETNRKLLVYRRMLHQLRYIHADKRKWARRPKRANLKKLQWKLNYFLGQQD